MSTVARTEGREAAESGEARERIRPPGPAPRLGFLGAGWIGRHRLDALAGAGAVVVGVSDPDDEAAEAVLDAHGGARRARGPDELLELGLDGVVIATPSALHAEQAEAVLRAGVPVFCQKPLGRTAEETARVVEAARRADRLLGVDMSYRHTAAVRAVRDRLVAGDLGDVYAAELVFHNAYGPDGEWFYDRRRSGGGCVMDLGIHLVDLVHWLMEPRVETVHASLFARGRPLDPGDPAVEDMAEIRLELDGGRVARVACSWNLDAGRDAVIGIRLHGTGGGAAVVNVAGSFYDFRAELYRGTGTEVLAAPPDDWGGRAAVAWLDRLRGGVGFDPAIGKLVKVAETMDRIYRR